MQLLKLVIRNAFRQKLRTFLTIFGIAVAVLAFCLLDTVVQAWYVGIDTASPNRLVSRNSVSLIFPLPLNYRSRIQMIDGVEQVAYANWFGGVYIDERHFFPRMAVGPENYFSVFPEFIIPKEQLKAFWKERNACIVGRKLIEQYGWKPGDTIVLTGNIYPGEWRFVLRGVYSGATTSIDETLFFFRWDYLDETLKTKMPIRAGQVGWYVIRVRDPADAAQISETVDALFKNSSAETLTETEKSFQAGFLAMTEAIVIAVRIVSYVVIGVILIILVNTMAMTSRERTPEYATLKTMGFGTKHLWLLIAGESVFISLLGAAIGMALSYPAAGIFSSNSGSLLAVLRIHFWRTLCFCGSAGFGIGIISALLPIWSASRIQIADALRHLG
ncbi:MAG: FtsX-like permease family protein [Syntrophobacteraceae bacterium]|jgi:putative ABC transport system permease protein